jgi:putative membrane protein
MGPNAVSALSVGSSWAAWSLLWANVAIVAFSLVGSLALAAGRPVPAWDYSRLSSTLAILNTATGFLVAATHMCSRHSGRRVVWLLGLCVVVAGGAELAGTLTGIPFGAYEYTDRLGPRLFGAVPYLIPLAWFMIVYASVSVAEVALGARWAAAWFAAAMVTAWDIALDPAMTAAFPAWVWAEGGAFYGIPLSNFAAWFGVALVIAGLYLRSRQSNDVGSSRLPWALYTVQSVLPAALAAIYGRALATVAWALAFTSLAALWALLRARRSAKTPPAQIMCAG